MMVYWDLLKEKWKDWWWSYYEILPKEKKKTLWMDVEYELMRRVSLWMDVEYELTKINKHKDYADFN